MIIECYTYLFPHKWGIKNVSILKKYLFFLSRQGLNIGRIMSDSFSPKSRQGQHIGRKENFSDG